MKVILTSSIGNSIKKDGQRIPVPILKTNGFLKKLQREWVENAKVMIIPGTPEAYGRNDEICDCCRQSFAMSGLSVSYVKLCDNRNAELADKISEMDVVLLGGGHVPSQNRFFRGIGLKDKLRAFDGLLLAWSAGSMNCAEVVYAGPELEGEAIDPDYKRWIPGLGVTNVNIFPHFQSLREEWLDGFRLIEDITFEDSMGHEIIALNDGTYITIEDGVTKIFGEAYRIKDGRLERICQEGASVVWETSQLTIKHNELTAEEFIFLWETVWGDGPSLEQTRLAMEHTLFRVSVYDGSQVVAMARMIGDMGLNYYIKDVVVKPDYQKRGIGKLLIRELLDFVKKNGVSNTGVFVELCAVPDKIPFYEKLGFDFDEGKRLKMMCKAE